MITLLGGLVLSLLTDACTPPATPFAGGFMADNRPHELIYLELTQAGQTVAGVLTLVMVDDEVGTTTDRYDVYGTADRERLSLAAEHFLGRTAALTVARAEGRYTLSVPTYNGESATLPLEPATADDVSRLVGDWTIEVEESRREREADTARTATHKRLSEELARALVDVRASTRRIRELGDEARVAVTDEQIRVQTLAGFVLQLRQGDVTAGDDLSARCSPTRRRRQAADRLSLDGSFAGEGSKLSDAIDWLDAELGTGRRRAAIARDRVRRIEEARALQPDVGLPESHASDELRTLDAYTAATDQAGRDLGGFRKVDQELRARSAELRSAGRALVQADPDDAECRPPLVLPDPILEPPPRREESATIE